MGNGIKHKKTKHPSGFTLAEVMIVLAIIAIMAAIAVPNIMDWLPNMRLKAEARELFSAMQKARSEAVKRNRDTAIIFDPANNSYSFCDNWNGTTCVGNSIATDMNLVGSGVGYGRGDSNNQVTGASWPLTPADDNVNYQNNRVVFNSKGLGSAGYVYLDHQDNNTTYAVGTQSSGVIMLKRWFAGGGGSWQ